VDRLAHVDRFTQVNTLALIPIHKGFVEMAKMPGNIGTVDVCRILVVLVLGDDGYVCHTRPK
jgi:hypothetical protein